MTRKGNSSAASSPHLTRRAKSNLGPVKNDGKGQLQEDSIIILKILDESTKKAFQTVVHVQSIVYKMNMVVNTERHLLQV